jgi:hypothetical protein
VDGGSHALCVGRSVFCLSVTTHPEETNGEIEGTPGKLAPPCLVQDFIVNVICCLLVVLHIINHNKF